MIRFLLAVTVPLVLVCLTALLIAQTAGRVVTPLIDSGVIIFEPNTSYGDVNLVMLDVTHGFVVPLVTAPGLYSNPAVSPDGAYLAFDRYFEGSAQIHVIDLVGGSETSLTTGLLDNVDPAWSPDGTRLAYVCVRDLDRREICMMRADGTEVLRLTTNDSYDSAPAWSPDGRSIVFSAETRGNADIMQIDLSTGETRPLIETGDVGEYSPVWDGSALLYSTNAGGDWEIVRQTFAAEGVPVGERINLTNAAGTDLHPAVSARYGVAFVSNRTGNNALWIMNGDGSSARRVYMGGLTSPPAWIP